MYSPLRHRSIYAIALLIAAALLLPQLVTAHHGWEWATDEEFEITGEILEVTLGNPHGEVTMEVDGREWTVQVGQPWRNERAGLTESILQRGVSMTVHGHRAVKEDLRVVKAERVVIDGTDYDLYPNRES